MSPSGSLGRLAGDKPCNLVDELSLKAPFKIPFFAIFGPLSARTICNFCGQFFPLWASARFPFLYQADQLVKVDHILQSGAGATFMITARFLYRAGAESPPKLSRSFLGFSQNDFLRGGYPNRSSAVLV